MHQLHQRTCWLLPLALLNSLPVLAQDSTGRTTRPAVLKTNLFGPFSVLLEVPVMPRRSVQFSVQRLNLSFFGKTRFFNVTADYRIYLGQRVSSGRRPAPNGLYISPYLKYRTVTDETTGSSVSGTVTSSVVYTMLGGGAVVGGQFINRWGLTIDAFIGAGYFPAPGYRVNANGAIRPPEVETKDRQLDIRPGVCIGLAF